MAKPPEHNNKNDLRRPKNAFCLDDLGPRLGEFDIGGVLYHPNYFHILEKARETLLRDGGCPYAEFVEQGCHLAVVEAHQKFLAPIRYGQAIRVYLWVSELRRTQLSLCYEITTLSSDETSGESVETTAHLAWTRQVFVASALGQFKTSRLPEKLVKILEQFT